MNLQQFEHLDPDLSVICTDYSRWAQQQLGRGRVVGFHDEDNPGTDTGRWAGGHDFLLVDNRWIVDLWSKNVACIAQQVVFDLQQEQDAEEIKRLFGDRTKWEVVFEE